jgi:hypothetical protein
MIQICDTEQEFISDYEIFVPYVLFSSYYIVDPKVVVHVMQDGSCFVKKDGRYIIFDFGELETFTQRHRSTDLNFVKNLGETLFSMSETYKKDLLTNENKKEILLELFNHFSNNN